MWVQRLGLWDSPGEPSPPPYLLRYRSSKAFILFTVSFAIFTDLFLYGIIVPVVPFALAARSGVHQDNVQHWVSVLLAVYGAALLIGSPICGWFADWTTSRRSPMLTGLLALTGSTIMFVLGKSVGVLIAARFLQGLSAAVIWVVGLALIVDTVGKDEVGRMMGYVSIAMSVGILISPILGGIVYARAGYHAVFAMAFGLIGIDIILRLILIEKKTAKKWKNEDGEIVFGAPFPLPNPTSTPTTAAASDAIELAPIRDTNLPTKSSTTRKEQIRQANPQSRKARFNSNLPPVITLLASRRLLTALWGSMVQAALLISFDSVLPLRVNRLFGWNSTGAGLIFLADVLPSLLAPIAGLLADKYGPRWFTVAGFIIGLPFLVLLRLVDHDSIRQKVLLCALLVFVGISLTLVLPPLMAEISYTVIAKEKNNPGLYGPKGAIAQAYGLFNMAFAAGALVGPIWAGFVEQGAGWATMTWTLGLLSGVSAIPAAFFTGGYIFDKRKRQGSEPVPSAEAGGEGEIKEADMESKTGERQNGPEIGPPSIV